MTYRGENWPEAHAGTCGCRKCAHEEALVAELVEESLSAALSHAQHRAEESALGLEAATVAGPITLPGRFSGWFASTAIEDVIANPPDAFKRPNRLYRIYESYKQSPLYIGMAHSGIHGRVRSHLAQTIAAKKRVPRPAPGSRSEIDLLRMHASEILGARGRIQVQHDEVRDVDPVRIDPKLLHAYEAALQLIERPKAYVGSNWTFEADDARI